MPTTFDESALKRLEALVAKSKSIGKLPPAEVLELKELKLLKQTADIAKGRAQIAVARRKIVDREKYRVGGLAVAAGLSVWNDDELKGGFAMLAGLGMAARGELADKGRQMAQVEVATTVLVPLRVSFAEMPSEAVLTEVAGFV